jgi:hypothetical protein
MSELQTYWKLSDNLGKGQFSTQSGHARNCRIIRRRSVLDAKPWKGKPNI